MINLLRYRAEAAYAPRSGAEPCSGREAYQRYGIGVMPLVAEAGGRMFWLGSVKQTVVGPDAEEWDDAVLVQYPSRKAFLGMLSRSAYQEIAIHRTAALADSRLILTATAAGVA
jgi:uncharacterized protein (DUF1330 family)